MACFLFYSIKINSVSYNNIEPFNIKYRKRQERGKPGRRMQSLSARRQGLLWAGWIPEKAVFEDRQERNMV